MKLEAKLGRTRFVLEETPSPGVLRVTRFNRDGEATFFLPKELFEAYAVSLTGNALMGLLKKAVV